MIFYPEVMPFIPIDDLPTLNEYLLILRISDDR